MPPLALTGERTLPDVPEENYWFRRHLAVYEWIAARVAGVRVIDMACGEGYGSDVLAASAASVVGVDANPEAHEHARLRYRRANLRFERDLVETFAEPADAVVFLQTIEHLQDPDAVLEHFRSLVGEWGTVYLSTPNVLTLAPKGAERSDNPWHVHEYRAEEFERLCRRHFGSVALFGLFHARKLRVHELALRAGWDCAASAPRPHRALLRLVHTGDRRAGLRAAPARAGRPGAGAGLRRGVPVVKPRQDRGALAIVLHTHMPYVEGFGTWPFGEEWLWEAIAGCYLPLLELLDGGRAADAVADAGAVRPARSARASPSASSGSWRRYAPLHPRPRTRPGCAPAGTRRSRASSNARGATTSARSSAWRRCGGDLLGAFAPHAQWTSSATHAVLPLLATDAGVRVQVQTGVDSHRAPLRRGGLARRLLAARVRVRALAGARRWRTPACAPRASS